MNKTLLQLTLTTTDAMTDERRREERFSLELKARIIYRHREESPVIETVSADISEGGAFLKSNHPFPMASKLQVEFLVSLQHLRMLKFILSVNSLRQLNQESTLWISTTGIVIRQQDDGVAVIFDKDYTITPMALGSSEV